MVGYELRNLLITTDQSAVTELMDPDPTICTSGPVSGGNRTLRSELRPRSFIAWKSTRDPTTNHQSRRMDKPAGGPGRGDSAGDWSVAGYSKRTKLAPPLQKFKSSKLASTLEIKLKGMSSEAWQLLQSWMLLQEGSSSSPLNSCLVLNDDNNLECEGSET